MSRTLKIVVAVAALVAGAAGYACVHTKRHGDVWRFTDLRYIKRSCWLVLPPHHLFHCEPDRELARLPNGERDYSDAAWITGYRISPVLVVVADGGIEHHGAFSIHAK